MDLHRDLHTRLRAIFRCVEERDSEGWLFPDATDYIVHYGNRKRRDAAVLCCIREVNNRMEVLLTKRSEKLSTHKGEICLPGGIREPQDLSLVATALREAKEEVNLIPELVQVVGTLPACTRILPYRQTIDQIITVIATLSPQNEGKLELTSNEEVDDMFWIPLDLFVSKESHCASVIYRDFPSLTLSSDNQFSLDQLRLDYIVWGLTAGICVMVSMILLQRPTHFPFTILLTKRLEEEAGVYVLAPLKPLSWNIRERNTVFKKSKL